MGPRLLVGSPSSLFDQRNAALWLMIMTVMIIDHGTDDQGDDDHANDDHDDDNHDHYFDDKS